VAVANLASGHFPLIEKHTSCLAHGLHLRTAQCPASSSGLLKNSLHNDPCRCLHHSCRLLAISIFSSLFFLLRALLTFPHSGTNRAASTNFSIQFRSSVLQQVLPCSSSSLVLCSFESCNMKPFTLSTYSCLPSS
jgi:hypothetical protein